MSRNLIVDIRYYEDCVDRKPVYSLPKWISPIGARFARKLHERSFETKDYNHIYLQFTPNLAHGQAEISPSRLESWLIYVNVGVLPNKFLQMDDETKFLFIVEMTTKALEFLCVRDSLNFDIVKKVEAEILQYNTELEISHKIKETSKYFVKIFYQIEPHGNASVAFIEYWDKKNNLRGRKMLLTLKNYEDIFFLVSNIAVKDGVIKLKPRHSFVAGIHTRSYDVPLEVAANEIVSAE